MLNLKIDKPKSVFNGFTASLSGNIHSKIPMDEIIEMTINRASKDTGGLSGKLKTLVLVKNGH